MRRKNIKGKFFLKGEKITYGDLKWQKNYAYIDLYSNPKSTNEAKYKSKHFFGVLNGQHAINIVNCTFRRFSFPFNDYTVDFEYLIRGYGTEWNKTETKIENYRANFNHLQEWTNIRGIVSDYEDGELKIKRSYPEYESKIYSSEKFEIRLQYETELPIINHSKNYTAKQSTFIELIDYKNQSLEEIFKLLDEFTALLRIISGVHFKIDNILQCKDDKQKDYFILRNKTDCWDGKEAIYTNNYLFTFDEIIDSVEINQLVENFFNTNDQFSQDIMLLSSCIGNLDMPLHYKFLNLMYVLDRVCSKKPKDTYEEGTLSTKDIRHLDFLRQKNVPNNTIKYLETKLSKTNFGKLKERLYLFLNSKKFISELNSEEKLENFIELTVNTRNHLAHGTFKEPILESDQIEYVNKILTNWISLIILKELGIPSNNLFSKTRIY